MAAGAASGVACWLAFPPADLGWVALVALVPLALALRALPAGAVAAAGAAYGVIFFGLLMSWILMFGTSAYLGLIGSQTVFLAAGLPLGRALVNRLPGGWKALAFPVTFLAVEWVRGLVPYGGLTWGGLGYSQHANLAALRLTSVTGAWGLSFLVAAVNAAVAEGVLAMIDARSRTAWRLVGIAAALVLLPVAVPAGEPDGEAIRVAMVQGNAPPRQGDLHADDLEVLANHVRLSRTLAGESPDLVVWPESSLDRDPIADPRFGAPLLETIREVGAPFVVGASLDRPGRRFLNASLFFGPDGTLLGQYAKTHLVPFGEYVPFRSLLEPVFREIQMVPRDGIPGREAVVFDLPQGRFASVICFESTYPSLVRRFVQRGARLLVVSTNNASYGRTAASEQHLAFSQVRAAEHRMWVVHTALTGISAVIDPSGEVQERTALFEPALLRPTVRFATGRTPYARLGDWLPIASALLVLASLVLSLAGALRRGRP